MKYMGTMTVSMVHGDGDHGRDDGGDLMLVGCDCTTGARVGGDVAAPSVMG